MIETRVGINLISTCKAYIIYDVQKVLLTAFYQASVVEEFWDLLHKIIIARDEGCLFVCLSAHI
jgi:hypothetical protein